MGHGEKGSFLFHLALHIFYFTTRVIVFASIGPQIYACIKQGKLKTLVTAMALYKLPGAESLIPNEGHAKYVCLDPWVNALVTLASLGTIANDTGIPWDNSNLFDSKVQTPHSVQGTEVHHCLSHICIH